MSGHCSTIVDCKIVMRIKCVHCEAINHLSQDMCMDDASKFDVEEITCWACNKSSLIDELLLEVYPEYPNESVGGHYCGKSSIDYT